MAAFKFFKILWGRNTYIFIITDFPPTPQGYQNRLTTALLGQFGAAIPFNIITYYTNQCNIQTYISILEYSYISIQGASGKERILVYQYIQIYACTKGGRKHRITHSNKSIIYHKTKLDNRLINRTLPIVYPVLFIHYLQRVDQLVILWY